MTLGKYAAIVAVALGAAGSAQAATVSINMTGFFTSGFDQSGVFGTPNTDLTGVAFSISESFDTTLGLYEAVGTNQTYSGGPGASGLSSPGVGTLTVNGNALALTGTYFSILTVNTATNLGRTMFADRQEVDGVFYEAALNTTFQSPGPLSITDGWDTDCATTGLCKMSFAMTAYDNPTIPGPHNTYYNNLGMFNGVVTSANVGVPEPSTWALMITGFGLMGVGLRRRRAVA